MNRARSGISYAVVLTASLFLLAGLAGTASSLAAVPAGLDCVASDGKINGRGATVQNNAEAALAKAYRDNFCGVTGVESTEKGEAGNTMIAYNYPIAEKSKATGAGAGLSAADCRTDAYAGSSTPYNKKQLEELNGSPGGGSLGGATCKIAFTPPFEPTPGPWPDTEAEKADQAAKVMTFPIAGTAEALPIHLTAAECGGTSPGPISLTPKEVDRLLGGEASKWNDAELVATDAALAKCEVSIVRVVRVDNAGATNTTKQYLQKTQPNRTGASCFLNNAKAESETWAELNVSPNTNWPTEGTCTELRRSELTNNASEVKKVVETPGAIGYADLSDAIGEEAKTAGLILANVENATGTSMQPPNIEKGANCDFKLLELPGTTSNEAVGLNVAEGWATNNPGGNKGDATDKGEKYPICGLTWDLVYTGLSKEEKSAITRLTADQRRTLYSYFTFILSSPAQQLLNTIAYAELPTSWVGTLREGFQKNF